MLEEAVRSTRSLRIRMAMNWKTSIAEPTIQREWRRMSEM
jgi:hypothetical protein